MTNDLAAPADLTHLPGAPFTDAEVDAAVASVREAAGWHIAPVRAETATLDVTCYDRWLRLPTRQLVSVTAVRNADTAEVVDPASYRVSRKLAQVKRDRYWPSGYEAIEVDMTHGYAETPADLFPVIAEAANLARRDQSIRSVQIDDFQQQFFAGGSAAATGTSQTLARYSLTGSALYGLGIA